MSRKTGTYLVGSPSGRPQNNDVSIAAVCASGGGNGLKIVDYRFPDDGQKYNIFGTLTTGAAIDLYVYPYPGDTATKHLEATLSVGMDTFNATTGTFSDVLNGPFWGVEGVKVGANGQATMIAYI